MAADATMRLMSAATALNRMDYDELEGCTQAGFERGTAARHGERGFATLTRVSRQTAHGTNAGWHTGCHCAPCRRAHSDDQRTRGRAWAQKRLPAEIRQQLLDAIYVGQPFRRVLRDHDLTSNQVWGLTKTDPEWSERLEAALMATRRDDLMHGTNATYVQECVCSDCQTHQRNRMARSRS